MAGHELLVTPLAGGALVAVTLPGGYYDDAERLRETPPPSPRVARWAVWPIQPQLTEPEPLLAKSLLFSQVSKHT